MPTHETEGAGRGLSEADGPECETCGKTICPDAELPEFSEPVACEYAPIYRAIRDAKDCDYGCARDFTNQAVRLRLVPAVERIVAEHVDTVLAEVAHWKRVAGHVREQAEAQQERAEQAEAEAQNAQADYDRCGERLWRLVGAAGYVPVESDNDATAEMVVADALAERDRLRAQVAACEALAEEFESLSVDLDGEKAFIASDNVRTCATRLRAALEDLDAVLRERDAARWDEGWRAGRGRGPGHTDACPGHTRHENPYRGGDDG